MRIFESNEWGKRINFVDENNVVLGYNMEQDCCEHAEYFILEELPEGLTYYGCLNNIKQLDKEDISSYRFDTSFFLETHSDCGEYFAVFRIINIGGEMKEAFIVLMNCHNGYYGHGFQFGKEKFEIIREGSL